MKLPALREIVEERKGRAIENLSESFAKNKLPLEEYERLVEYINKIESERELIVVERMVSAYGESESPSSPDGYEDDEPESPFNLNHHHGEDYSHSSSNLTILSSRTFSGPVKSRASYVVLLGSGHIKIRQSDMPKKRTHLNVVSILGETTVSVESGIRVVNNSVPILGGVTVDQRVQSKAMPGAPELIIAGAALLGDITVKLLKE